MSKTPVSILQEMMVKQNMVPDYELIHDGGGRHVNIFTYRVTCDGLSATGTGRCKKDAKHEAAKAMLTEIAAHKNYPQLPAASTPISSPSKSPFHSVPLPPKNPTNVPFFNAIGELQDLCAENNLQEPEYHLIRDVGPPHARTFTIRCKVSNFEEDGISTTKKQAKHDAAKKMIDRIKGLVNNSTDFYKKRNQENSSDSSDTEVMNKNAEERYCNLKKVIKKVNLGIKLAEYHNYWRDSLEEEKRNKVLQQLDHIFPSEFFVNEDITDEFIMENMSKLKTVLLEIDVSLNTQDIISDLDSNSDCYFMKALELNVCPIIRQIGVGKNNTEASWKALSQMIKSIKLLLS